MAFLSLYSIAAIAIIIGVLIFSHVRKFPLAQSLVIACFAVFIVTFLSPSIFGIPIVFLELSFIPVYLLEPGLNLLTIFTSMFVHGDIMHLLLNMLVLLFLGAPFEQRVGRKIFAILYFAAGIGGALLFSVLTLEFTLLIGASGAIFGILGAYAVLYPRDEVAMFLGFIFLPRVPVLFVAIGLALLETLYATSGMTTGVANLAHIGGLVTGVFLAPVITRRVAPPRAREINYLGLSQLAKTMQQRDMLSRIQFETEPDVKKVWLQHYLENVACPDCGKSPKIQNNKVVCCDLEIPLYISKKKR